ncbi:nuclear transport factor 2 family protein [Sphingobacterium sp.]|uniref:nuclear transport factor 2 family protein n=1 Tax=Sphingobacterium sp. TaxID=341027 RepID=UPI002582DEE8|nr:nuclear transport factor 2 family protein [Sphingobacterium sp.]WET68854.1 MAG: nuclear transport factor 2 family protein [Sphingobacterium sp.]
MKNITILHRANEFIAKGDYESFLAYCTAETKWVFIGERILHGKEEVRAYLKEFYQEPPVFDVEKSIEEGDFVMVTGEIRLRNKEGKYDHFDYCDIWRFEDGKMAELKGFVIEKQGLLLPSSE